MNLMTIFNINVFRELKVRGRKGYEMFKKSHAIIVHM